MWTLKDLMEHVSRTRTEINGLWVPARPLNYKREYMTLIERFKHAWAVFTCRAEAFTWPDGQ